MNCEEIVLPALRVSLPLVKESLRCLVSTILFTRSIGGNAAREPKIRKSEILQLEYCHTDDELELTHYADKTLLVNFYLPRPKKTSLWDILSQPFQEKAVFERWRIPVAVAAGLEDEEEEVKEAREQVRICIRTICKKMNEKIDHLPPPPMDRPTYHFEITCGEQAPWSPRSIAQSIKNIPFIT